MTHTRIIGTLLVTLLLMGCASNPSIDSLSSEQRAKYGQIEVVSSSTSRPHTVLGAVKGISCHRNAYQSRLLTSDEAMEGVKLQAAQLQADAVINVACQKKSEVDWGNNCWASIVCVGDAVKFK
jgi:uncharacterized protein YbjQ (UPF0145 family)